MQTTPRTMSIPLHSTDAALAQQLDALARQGQRLLDRAALRVAVQRGLRWALAGSAVGPALALMVAFWVQLPMARWLLGCALLPVLLAALPLLGLRRGASLQRHAALALLDRRAGAQDRLTAADQFLAERSLDGFRQAALRDAQAWIGPARQASQAPIAVQSRPIERWRFAMPVLAAALLLAAALVSGQRAGAAAARDASVGRGSAGVSTPVLAPTDADRTRIPPADVQRAATPAGRGRSDAAQPSAQDIGSANPQMRPGAAQGESGKTAAAAAARSAASTSASGGAGEAKDAAAAASSPNDGAGLPADAEQQRQMDDAAMSASDAAAASGNGDGMPEAGAISRERQPLTQPAQSALSPGAGAAQPPSQSGSDPGQASRQQSSERGDQGQSQGDGQHNGQGQGQGQGTDGALKRTRGLTGLLLGVPMEDQLTGTPNRGRVRSITRPSDPQGSPATPTPAQSRGSQSGDAGPVSPRPASAADQRLVRDYFLLQRKRGDSATEN